MKRLIIKSPLEVHSHTISNGAMGLSSGVWSGLVWSSGAPRVFYRSTTAPAAAAAVRMELALCRLWISNNIIIPPLDQFADIYYILLY